MNLIVSQPEAKGDRSALLPAMPLQVIDQAMPDLIEQGQLLSMENAFCSTGGMVTCNEMVDRLQVFTDQPIRALAKMIVHREALSFDWHRCTLLPLFQFELKDMSVLPCVTQVILELSDVFDQWSLALWFAEPSVWLSGCSPATVIASDPRAVFEAARTDRFIERG